MLRLDRDFPRGSSSLDALMRLYGEADAAAGSFMRASGAACLKSCGQCCKAPSRNIEATVFELLPLAVHLFKIGEAEEWLKRAEEALDEDWCVLFSQTALAGGADGGCLHYGLRPLVCRLFGFASSRDKAGAARRSLCWWIKESNHALSQVAGNLASAGLAEPSFADYSFRLLGIDPDGGARLYPINMALAQALKKVLFRMSLLYRSEEKAPRPSSLDAQ